MKAVITETKKVVAAFESATGWQSSLYLLSQDGEEELNKFCEGNKGSFAKLNVFTDEADAILAYEKYSWTMS